MAKKTENDMSAAVKNLFGGATKKEEKAEGGSRAKARGLSREAINRIPLGAVSSGGRRPRSGEFAIPPHVWTNENSGFTSLRVDSYVYDQVRLICRAENMSLKDVLYFMMKDGVARYNSGELSLHD